MTKNLNALNATDYRAAVLKTESKPKELSVGPMTIFMALNLAVETSNVLDQLKRAVFYGKDIDQEAAIKSLQTIGKIAADISFPIGTGRYRDPRDGDFFQGVPVETRAAITPGNVNLRLLHAALGLQTESGEFIEGLLPSFFGGPIDAVNLLEELGDGPGWYAEVALDELGFTREQCNFTNIKKLQDKKDGRYKKGAFNPNEAIDRDVNAERGLLEAGSDRKLTDAEATAIIHQKAA